MTYRLPSFNLPYRYWTASQNPYTDDPASEGMAQKYLYSRADPSTDPPAYSWFTYIPSTSLRAAAGTGLEVWGFVELPTGGQLYTISFVETCHQGFPNEYVMATILKYPPPPWEPPWSGSPPHP